MSLELLWAGWSCVKNEKRPLERSWKPSQADLTVELLVLESWKKKSDTGPAPQFQQVWENWLRRTLHVRPAAFRAYSDQIRHCTENRSYSDFGEITLQWPISWSANLNNSATRKYKDLICIHNQANSPTPLHRSAVTVITPTVNVSDCCLKGRSHQQESLEKHCQQNHCFPLVQRAYWPFLSSCCVMHFSGGFWVRIKVKIISTCQLKVPSGIGPQCHLWLKQLIKLSRRRALLLSTFFLFCCRGNSSGNNRILATTDRKLILAVFSYRCASKALLEQPQSQSSWCDQPVTHVLVSVVAG